LNAIWKRRLPKEFRRTAWARVPVFWFAGTPEKDRWPHPVEVEKLDNGDTSVTIVWGGDDATAGLLQLTVAEVDEKSADDASGSRIRPPAPAPPPTLGEGDEYSPHPSPGRSLPQFWERGINRVPRQISLARTMGWTPERTIRIA